MPSCAFFRCSTSKTKNKSNGVTYHRFPQDELWRHKWLKVIRQQRQQPDWLPNDYSRVCSIHFKSEDMCTTHKGYKKIIADAVPYFQSPMKAAGSTSSNSVNNVSDVESDVESPRIIFLKKKLIKQRMKNGKLMQVNKILKRKCIRLDNKCKKLKEIIVLLKKKINVDH